MSPPRVIWCEGKEGRGWSRVGVDCEGREKSRAPQSVVFNVSGGCVCVGGGLASGLVVEINKAAQFFQLFGKWETCQIPAAASLEAAQ